ncbi:hypothetical protein FACS1894201_11680 [Bacteroidia bacterium]|nr:hypothetical protein FACS1894201_11680 [Bacteroidia bacterium]
MGAFQIVVFVYSLPGKTGVVQMFSSIDMQVLTDYFARRAFISIELRVENLELQKL